MMLTGGFGLINSGAKPVDIEDIDHEPALAVTLSAEERYGDSPSHPQQPCNKNQPNPTIKHFLFFDLQPVKFLRFTVIIVYIIPFFLMMAT